MMEPSLLSSANIVHATAVAKLDTSQVRAALETVRPIAEHARTVAVGLLNEPDAFKAETHVAALVSRLLCLPEQDQRINSAILTAFAGSDGDTAAAGLLRAISAVTSGNCSAYAIAEAKLLGDQGISSPAWTRDLSEPIVSTGSWLLSPVLDSGGAPRAVMVLGFRRAGAEHGFIIHFDHPDDGSIRLLQGLRQEAWVVYRRALHADKALDTPYGVEEVAFDAALDHFDPSGMATWARLSSDPGRYRDDPERAAIPGMTMLLENHMAAARSTYT